MITAGFLANGVKVYITARKAGPLIDKAKELSDQYGQECIAIPSDLSSHGGIVEFADELKTRESSVDFLINNAGAAWAEPLDTFSEEGWDRVMDLNVKSYFLSLNNSYRFSGLMRIMRTLKNYQCGIN